MQRAVLGVMAAILVLIGDGIATGQADDDFGKAIQLAPFVVKGSPLSISIHARTTADRRYAEKFADEVIEIAYETVEKSSGKGIIFVGAKGEPHPVFVLQKFLEMARAGQLDLGVVKISGESEGLINKFQEKIHFDVDPNHPTGITSKWSCRPYRFR